MNDKPWDWDLFFWHFVQVVIYAGLGLAFFALTYFLIDKMTPFSFRREIIDQKNIALAILLGAVFLAIAVIVAAAIR